jgi:hypothetical protein
MTVNRKQTSPQNPTENIVSCDTGGDRHVRKNILQVGNKTTSRAAAKSLRFKGKQKRVRLKDTDVRGSQLRQFFSQVSTETQETPHARHQAAFGCSKVLNPSDMHSVMLR